MTIWIDTKYATLLANRLPLFKVKRNTPFVANFRDPDCGDSAKSKTKARGYIYEKKGKLFKTCHNCNVGMTFQNFLKTLDPGLYQEYRLECLRELGTPIQPKPVVDSPKPKKLFCEALKGLKRISQLEPNHICKRYIEKRRIPTRFHWKLYHCPKFMTFTNGLIPGKFSQEALRHDEPRLLIPFFSRNGKLVGYQGRSFKPDSEVKYITIMLDETHPKIWGLDQVTPTRPVWVLEGALDAMFIPNSIAMNGSDSNDLDMIPKDKITMVFDNEPRNSAIVKKIKKSIDNGFKVVIFPDHVKGKDINDLVLAGHIESQIVEMLHTNSCSGLVALSKFNQWKKMRI
jgi:hypothetical protein